MPRYSYVALSPEYQKLTGVISAQDEKDAREQLHRMHLSVVSISVTDEEVTQDQIAQEGIKTFYFKVKDQKGNLVDGTIDSVDKKTAYRRLVSEYHFQIQLLCDVNIPEDQRETQGREGLEEIAQKLEEEFGITQEVGPQSNSEEKNAQYDDNFNKKKDLLLKEVENVCKKAKTILEEHSEKLSPQQDQNIRNRLDELMRMRLSNNLNHIESLTDDLFSTVMEVVNQNQLEDIDTVELETNHEERNELEDNQKYKKAVSNAGLLRHFQNISDKFNDFLKSGKKASKPKIQKKKSDGEFFKLIKEGFENLKGILFAKNKARRQESLNKLKSVFERLKEWRKKKSSEKKKALVDSKDSQRLRRITDTGNYLFFAEAKTFLGWLLGMYILYFFFAYYTKFKWGQNAPFIIRDFVDNSIRTSFIFVIAGILFLLFLAFSIEVHFDRKNIFRSVSIFTLTLVMIVLFVINL